MRPLTIFLSIAGIVLPYGKGNAEPVCGPSAEKFMSEEFMDRIDSKTVTAVDEELGFYFAGPKGWPVWLAAGDPGCRVSQPEDPSLFAMYKKNYGRQQVPFPFTPYLEVHHFDNPERKTSLEILRIMSEMGSSDKQVITSPAEITFGNFTWAVYESARYDESQGTRIPLKRKSYLATHKSGAILVQGTSTTEEYPEDVRMFDEAISNAKFLPVPSSP